MKTETGYVKASELLYRVFTVSFSLVALALAAPLFLVIALVIVLVDGLPVFYAGTRLGKDKRPFLMYKFRTLVPDAERRIGGSIFQYSLSSNRELLTRTGKFLRETRLDELPQFVNTLRGDMDLIGPRPIRPEQYERFCRNIPGFDYRFTVRPGLIGYAQLFTPHTAPKRIRSLIDYKFLRKKHLYSSELILVVASLGLITLKLVGRIFAVLARDARLLFGPRRERRALDRQSPKGVTARIRGAGDGDGRELPVLDVNEEAIAVGGEAPAGASLDVEIRIPALSGRGRAVVRTVRCAGEVLARKVTAHGDPVTVLRYRPRSPLNYYLVHQHLMHGSIFRRP